MSDFHDDCFICQKHRAAAPLGGYIERDPYFRLCHAPANLGGAGTLLIEASRHLLDFSEMTPAESHAYGNLLRWAYTALRQLTMAERIYAVVLLEGIPHFHAWLVPRAADSELRGIALLQAGAHCTEADVAHFMQRLTQHHQSQPPAPFSEEKDSREQ